jgi:hypothetical protein
LSLSFAPENNSGPDKLGLWIGLDLYKAMKDNTNRKSTRKKYYKSYNMLNTLY